MEDTTVDEETPLLRDSGRTTSNVQLAITVAAYLCEPLSTSSISPYINQLIAELCITGGDKRRVGYYTGLIESLFYVTQAATAGRWVQLSKRIGCKPVLLIGLAGNALSMLCFGLSRTFWALAISRCFCGLWTGNGAVLKNMVGELRGSTSCQRRIAIPGLFWAIGTTLGPALGGMLSRPHDRFPTLFSGTFWKEYPYFLPCVAVASSSVVSSLMAFFNDLREDDFHLGRRAGTLPPMESSHPRRSDASSPSPRTVITTDELKPPTLLTYPGFIVVANCACIAFSELAFFALLALFISTPVEYGGLGSDPVVIGSILAAVGAYSGVFQALFAKKLVRYFGQRQIFILGTWIISMNNSFLFPVIKANIKRQGVTGVAWFLLGSALPFIPLVTMSFDCIFSYMNVPSQNKRSLGASGIEQIVFVSRSFGPWMATSLFAISLDKNLSDGNAVFVVLLAFSCLALVLAACLPHSMWDNQTS